MATTTLRPDAAGDGTVTVVGAGGVAHTALNDNSDGSYCHNGNFAVAMGSVVLPLLAQIRSVTARVSYSNTETYLTTQYGMRVGGSGNPTVLDSAPASSITTVTGTARTTTPAGAAWTQAALEDLYFRVSNNEDEGTNRVYEAYLDVVYNEVPVVTVTAPVQGSTIATTTPTVSWTFTDPEGDAQERYQVKIFSSAQYSANGFNPTTDAAVWDSGFVTSANGSATCPVVLTQSTTYRAYVRIADAGSNGRYSNWIDTDLAYNQFTIATTVSGSAATPGTGPATPTLAVADIPATARISLDVTTRDNLLIFNQSSFEADVHGVRPGNATVARSTVQFTDGAASLALTTTATSNTFLNFSHIAARWEYSEVTAGSTYTGLCSIKAGSVSRNATLSINWQNSAGTSLSISPGTTQATSTGGWTQFTVTDVAPVGAAYADLSLTITSTAAGEVNYIDKASFAPGSSTTWSPGGFVAGPNLLTAAEASFEGGIGDWIGLGNSVARSDLQKHTGNYSLLMTSTATTNGWAQLDRYIDVIPNKRYSATGQILAGSTGKNCRIFVEFYASNDAFIQMSEGGTVVSTSAAWTRLFWVGIAPSNAVYALVFVAVDSPGSIGLLHYIDRMQFCLGHTDLWLDPSVTKRRTMILERSTDNVTFTQLARPVVPDLNTSANLAQPAYPTLYDYEVASGQIYYYRVKVRGEV